jgi:two-component system, chemotaxis family, sensor histidine kinase and response regulator WspE
VHSASPIDESLLDLFRQEAAAQTVALDEALPALAVGGDGAKKMEDARQAIRALLGAARLVGLELAVPVAQAMENLLARDPERPPAATALAALRQANDWLRQISPLAAADLSNPPAAVLAAREACLQELIALTSAPTPPPTEKKQSEQSPQLETRNSKLETILPPEPQNAKLDFNLLDMYRDEAASQLAALAAGLVELEGDLANPKKIEPIMRAAHSLKGAASIIGLDLAVGLAHAMEDALVAAQHARITLDAAGIDALLRAGDWLGQFSKLPQDQLIAPLPDQVTSQSACLAEMKALLAGAGIPGAKATKATEATKEQSPPPPDVPKADSLEGKLETRNSKLETSSSSAPADAVVRVSAASLSRLMGLAAETLVESRRLEPFRDRLLKLKNDQMQFVSRLEAVQAAAADPGAPAPNLESLRAAAQATLEGLRAQLENLDHAARRNTHVSGRLYQEVIASRLRPFADGAQALPRLVRDVARTLGKQARLEIAGRETPVDRDILEKLEAPLSHLLRNACDHGLESPAERLAAGKPAAGLIRLEARHRAGMLVVQVSDDGRGIALPRLREKIIAQGRATAAMAAAMSDDEVLEFLFLPGFSTAEQITEISGRGVGLDVVQALAREVGGAVRIFTGPGRGTTFTLQLPVTRSVISALVAEIDGEAYAFPLAKLHRALRAPRATLALEDGLPQVAFDGALAVVVSARRALGLPGADPLSGAEASLVVFGHGAKMYALEVDRILGEMDLVVRPLDPRLGKVQGISAAAIGEDGAPILFVDVDDLPAGLEKIAAGAAPAAPAGLPATPRRRILIVDDSATVRATEQQILEQAGFEVETATDGADGWNLVRLSPFDLVVSDVDMPRLNGLEFVARLRADARLQHLPVVMVSYKDRPEDHAAGRAAGANVYLAKSSFQDETFLRAVHQLLEVAR